MQRKEILMVLGGAFLLTNFSIVGTLLVTGHFDSDNAPNPEPATEPLAQKPVAEASTSPKLHSMADAMYLCEEKLNTSNKGKQVSYEFGMIASRFSEDSGTYHIFINTQSASRANSPQESSEVTCDVSANDMKIIGYKAMKKK